ncbi:MAG: hypothetical protein QNJ37_15935 [Crocosphaera sp.]|nr:hypothetical protein [Crocosphaera sp.]
MSNYLKHSVVQQIIDLNMDSSFRQELIGAHLEGIADQLVPSDPNIV